MSRVVVIGAGVGGLAAAVRLGARGHEVTVLEQAAAPGGKMSQVTVGGLRFDGGPSVLTMPWVFDDLFAAAGEERAAWVRFRPLQPACRHFFADGVVLDLCCDEDGAAGEDPWARSADEVARVLGATAAAEYRAYRRHAATIYAAVQRPFLQRALPRTPLGLLVTHQFRDSLGLLRLDARRTLWQSLGRFFTEPHLRVLFARYATYCGSDPFLAPATLNVIPHVELGFGVYEVEGGMHRLAQALAALAERFGARICHGAAVERVELRAGQVAAVHVGGERIAADAVVANCDVAQLYGRLLSDEPRCRRRAQKVAALPASLSAQLLLCAVRGAEGLPLCHHNVFFSADYAREFAELTGERRVPTDPTVYLCAPDSSGGADRAGFGAADPAAGGAAGFGAADPAAGGAARFGAADPAAGGAAGFGAARGGEALSRWFFLVNAPPLAAADDLGAGRAGDAAGAGGAAAGAGEEPDGAAQVRAAIVAQLGRHGIDLPRHAAAERSVTPADFAARFPLSRGSLYGAASNSRLSAFYRPPNRVREVRGLYCVGGSTHPGAGVPMVALSAQITCELLDKDFPPA